MSNVQPTKYGQVIVFGLSALRLFILYKPSLNMTFTNGFLYTEIIHIIVFLIGLYLSIECLLSIFNYFWSLELSKVLRYTEYRPLLSLNSILWVLCMTASLGNAVQLYIGVRDLWTQHFALLIQVLHPVPTILLIVQAIVQGMYLLVINNNVRLLQVKARPQLQSQQQLNKALLTYVFFTVIVTARYNEDMSEFPIYYTVCTVGDLLYRTLCWLSMKSLLMKETRRDDEEEEEERFTVPAKQEEMYNPRKEMFCHGELY